MAGNPNPNWSYKETTNLSLPEYQKLWLQFGRQRLSFSTSHTPINLFPINIQNINIDLRRFYVFSI